MKFTNTLAVAALAALANLAITSTALSVQPPIQDLKLQLSADTGVTTAADGVSVQGWADQAPGVKHDGIAQGTGIPILTTNENFPAGPRPTIAFDGASAIVLTNRDDLQKPAISVYVVGSVDNTYTVGIFLADMRDPFGFALGISDTTAGRARWYTGYPGDNMEPAAADLGFYVPNLIEGSFQDGRKQMFLNGVQIGDSSGISLNYATFSALAVGAQGTYPSVGEQETGEPAVLSKFLIGDVAEILAYSSASDAQRLAVEAYIYQKYFTHPTGAAAFAKQPFSQQVNELAPVTFSVNADGEPPLSYYWFRNGVAIPSANDPYYTLSRVSRTDAGQFSVVVSNATGTVTSTNAVLTVIPDTTPPTLFSADRDVINSNLVTVVFSKPVSAATATVAATGGTVSRITVNQAAMGTTPDTVLLTTSPIAYGPAYTLTVNGIQDLVGNTIAANSQHRVAVPEPNAPVPTIGLKLWLRADLGVTANASGVVSAWADHQVGNPPKNGTAVGTPMLTQASYFPNGPHPVITFDGASGFNLDNVADMRMTNMTFYIVTSVSAINTARMMIANYRDVAGWGVGISDSIAGRVKWFTAPPNSMEPDGAQLTELTPVLLTATYSSAGGVKKLYVNSVEAGSATGVNLSYASDTQLTVGYLQGNRQYLVGDIAEILAYSRVSDSQRTLVEAYLSRKYFGQGSGPVVVTEQPQSQTVNELQPVSFEVGFDGAPPVTIQWFKNDAAIPGATNVVYTIPNASRADQGAQFNAHLSNASGSAVSSNATLTVILDTVPPVLVSAKRDYMMNNQVLVIFSKAVSPSTATVVGNYAINNGVTVSQATIGSNSQTVILTTSPITPGAQAFTLTVNGVQDLVGNPIAANSQVPLSVPATSLQPPTTDLLCWMAADAGISTSDGHTVTNWLDQAGGDSPHNLAFTVGSPQLVMSDLFPSGANPVIHFDGGAGIQLQNPDSLAAQSISEYVVVSTDEIDTSRIFFNLYTDTYGYGMGISDSTPGRIKWFTAPPNSLEPDTANLTPNVPAVITGTFDSSTASKALYMGTNLLGTATDIANIDYGANPTQLQPTIGYLMGNRQYLVGNIAEVLVYSSVSDEQRIAVQNYLIQKYFTPGGGPVAITMQPAGQTIDELEPVTFNVGYLGTPPVSIQWYKNGNPIPGATDASYTIPSVTRADQGAQFSAHLSNTLGTAVSSDAVLTVIEDNVVPVLLSAKRDYLNDSQVLVVFSKPVDPVTATTIGNYAINNGVTVSQAAMGPNSSTVILTTSPIAAGQTFSLTVNGIQDLVGNSVAANSKIAMAVPATSLRPPTTDLLLWLAADAGVSTSDGHTLTNWVDQAGGDLPHNLAFTVGSPQLATADFFTSGVNQVIHFDGNSGVQLQNPDTMATPSISEYVVVSTDVINASRIFFNLYTDTYGFGLGISDGVAGRIKWFTAPPNSMEPDTATLSANVPTMVTGTFEQGGTKKLYMGTNLVGSATGLAEIDYGADPTQLQPTVGYLMGNRQYLLGTVAEVLVYSSVSDAQRNAVQDYLTQKYFTSGLSQGPKLNISLNQNQVVISWTGGGVLQSATQLDGTWTDVSGASSPWTITLSGTSQFYRLRQ
ncbi:MAG: hypothetical protein M1608_07345 [Candidatus Omnitrophica bacterium]|nr:hypothetical protein [Candidatus Omnitrophota bacterium]